jgi:hypothetical protein
LTLGVTLAAALAAITLLGLGGRVARADPPGPISFDGARSEMQTDMSISRSASDAAAQDAYWAATEAQEALTYAKEAAAAAKRCDKDRFEQWKELFQSAMDQSNTEENRARDWQDQANTAYGQAQKRLSDMQFFADAGNAAQANDIANMSSQLDALNAHELDNLANEKANLDLAGVLRSQAQAILDQAQIDIDNCGDQENDVAPPDDNGDGSQSDAPGGAGSLNQPSGDNGTQSGTSSGGTDSSGQPTAPVTPPSGTSNGTGATGGNVSHQPVLLSRSECRGGFWHVITYDVSDPNQWVQISDQQTVQPCAVPGDPTSNTTPTTNNGSNQPNGMPQGNGGSNGTGSGMGSGTGTGNGTGGGQTNTPGTSGQPTGSTTPGGMGGTQPGGTMVNTQVQLSIPVGPAGVPVVLDGMGFTPGSHLTVCWQSAMGSCQQLASFASVVVSPTGGFVGSFVVPSDTPGPHQIVVRDQAGRQASATFTLLPIGAAHAG